MVRAIFSWFDRDILGVHSAAYLLAFSAFLSQVLALARDRLFAHTFGASQSLDVYYSAFRIQDFIFIAVASFVSLSVLIPFFSKYRARGEAEFKSFLNSVFSLFFVAVSLASSLAFLFAPTLVPVLFPGFAGSPYESTLVTLSRIMLLSPILLGLSNLLASLLQLHHKYLVYALSPLLYNLGIILGVLYFYPLFGLIGLGYGVLLGALLHLLIQLPTIMKLSLLPRLVWPSDWRGLLQMVGLSLPRTLALSANHLSLLLLTAFATLLAPGSITVLSFSVNLQAVAISIIGASYSVAAFPALAASVSQGEREKFLGHFFTALRHVVFWSFPAMVLFIVLRAQVVRVILGSGAFDWTDTRLTAASLAILALAIVPQNLSLLFARAYYALGNTRVPLFSGLFSALLTAFSAYALLPLMHQSGTRLFFESLLRVEDIPGVAILALPLGLLIGSFSNLLGLLLFAPRYFPGALRVLAGVSLHSFSASVVMGAVAYVVLEYLGRLWGLATLPAIFFQGFLAGLAGIFCGGLMLYLFRNRELADILESLHKRFWKKGIVASPEQIY